jgi:hypothetical protein
VCKKKVINQTEPLSNGEVEFSGIWYPTFVVDNYQMFISPQTYITLANLTATTVTIVISETSYYIQNREFPIAKQTEIIFHDLLFTIVVLEIFGLIYLIFKLGIIPLAKMIVKHFHIKTDSVPSSVTKENVHQETVMSDLDDFDFRF